MLVSYVVVTAMLYRLFKPASASMSFLAAIFSLVGISILATSMSVLLLPLQLEGALVAHDALRLHGATYNLTGLFFGPYCVLIGSLAIRSRLVPAWIGGLMFLAGLTFVMDAALEVAAPVMAKRIPDPVLLISLVGEGALALWLTVFGVRQPLSKPQI
jgi:hypothetical protein